MFIFKITWTLCATDSTTSTHRIRKGNSVYGSHYFLPSFSLNQSNWEISKRRNLTAPHFRCYELDTTRNTIPGTNFEIDSIPPVLPSSSCQRGGVFWSKGEIHILGGHFPGNSAQEGGGALCASVNSFVTLAGGFFEGNTALDGGVVNAESNSEMLVEGGVLTGNIATNRGGAFYVVDGAQINVSPAESIVCGYRLVGGFVGGVGRQTISLPNRKCFCGVYRPGIQCQEHFPISRDGTGAGAGGTASLPGAREGASCMKPKYLYRKGKKEENVQRTVH